MIDTLSKAGPRFVVGDLVYFLGYYKDYHGVNEYGVILNIDGTMVWRDMIYHVFWFERGYIGQYSGSQLVLVYEVDMQTENITLNKW